VLSSPNNGIVRGQKGPAGQQAGVIHLALNIIIVLIAVAAIWTFVIYLLLSQGVLKKAPIFGPKKEPTVGLKTEYKNPFDKKTQYINPFDQFKSPFQTLK